MRSGMPIVPLFMEKFVKLGGPIRRIYWDLAWESPIGAGADLESVEQGESSVRMRSRLSSYLNPPFQNFGYHAGLAQKSGLNRKN